MRLVDADALVEQVCLDGDCTQCKTGVNEKVCKWNMFRLKDVIDYLEHAPTIDAVPRWIPCEERLPEPTQEVLVTGTNGCVYTSRIVHGEFEYGGNVIAWMPLPEPYEGERRDDD